MHKTISYDQDEILHAINALYLDNQGIDLDPMYGKGGFYKKFKRPGFAFDIAPPAVHPEIPYVGRADATVLDLHDGCMRSMILDPPFMHAQGKDSALKRYATYPSQKALHQLYIKLVQEAARVLAPEGILIFKCQDTVESGKQVWNHIYVHAYAEALGFEALDLFILLARSRLTGHNHGRQVHARKHHAYFWVFRKRQVRQGITPLRMTDADGNVWEQIPLE